MQKVNYDLKIIEAIEAEKEKERIEFERIEAVKKSLQGKDGTGITRQVDVVNKKVVFKKTNSYSSSNAFGTLGYLSRTTPTTIKVTFTKYANYYGYGSLVFGLARDELDISSSFHDIGKQVNNDYPFYGIFPYNPSSSGTNSSSSSSRAIFSSVPSGYLTFTSPTG